MEAILKNGKHVTGKIADVFIKIGIAETYDEDVIQVKKKGRKKKE